MDIAAIIDQLSPGAQVTRAAPLAGGVSAKVHEVGFVRLDGLEEFVVVRQHRNIDGKADRRDRAAREHALLSVLHQRGLPVPRSRLFVPPDTLVLDRIEGTTSLPDDPVEALASTLAAIHSVEIDATFPVLPLLDDPLPALVEWLPQRLANDPPAANLQARDTFRIACRPYTGRSCLLHGDYWPGNVMWHEGRLIAVLDWEDAAIGDPLSDVACARVELCCARDELTAERFSKAYARISLTDMTRLPWWDLFVSTAALQYMDGWGLAPEVLAARRAATTGWQETALEKLGID